MPVVPSTPPPIPITVLNMIMSSLRLIGVLASGENPEAAAGQDALFVLNQMLDSWSAERLMIFQILGQEFPLVVGQQVYTMGSGGNFNTARPPKIDRISIVSLQNPNQPLELPMNLYTVRDWQLVPVKNITSTLPEDVYDDGAFPLRNLNYWPVPQIAVNTIIYSWAAISGFTALNQIVSFPPGYAEAIRYNLALRLIAEFPGNYNAVTMSVTDKLATDSLARVKSMNIPLIEAVPDAALLGYGGRYNIFSDETVGGRW